MKSIYYAAVGLTATAGLVFADPLPIDSITITGNRSAIPAPYFAGRIDSLDRQDIENAPTLALADLLASFAGLTISQSGGFGALTELRLRGAESNHVLVLIDGVAVNDVGQGGLVDFAHLNTAHIERIDLLRGPQSALWGSGAVAGVISITTRQPQASPRKWLSIEAGEQQSHRFDAGAYGKRGDLGYAFAAGHIETEGSNIARQGDERDGYQQTQFSSNLNWQATPGHRFDLSARYVDYRSDFDGVDFATTGLPADADNVSDGEQLGINLRWHTQPVKDVWHSTVEFQHYQSEADNSVEGNQASFTKGKVARFAWLNHWPLDDSGHINLLTEFTKEDFTQRGPIGFGDPNQRQSTESRSIAAETLYSLTDTLSFNLTGRYDNNDVFDNATSYRAGASYRISNALSAYISHGKAVKNPTFLERFGFFPAQFLGNPELQPEHSTSNEVGIDWQASEQLTVALSWFDSRLENEINGFVFNPESGQFTAQNVDGNSDRQGVELALRGDWHSLVWRASYSYIDTSEGDDEQPELRRARHQASLALQYRWLNDKAGVSTQLNYTGSRLDQFFPPFPASPVVAELSAYSKMHVAFDYRLSDRWQFKLGAENLLDESTEDVVGFVSNGRRAYASVNLTW